MFKVRLIIATQKYLGGFHLVRPLNYYGVLVIQTFFIKNSIINSTKFIWAFKNKKCTDLTSRNRFFDSDINRKHSPVNLCNIYDSD